jgi:alpha-L-arabinofuranosidase
MHAALGEAVYMMGMENNSDVVPLNSYAPIFVNENDAKWRPDMIRFNAHQVMGTPSYYVQMLMPRHLGKQVVRMEQTDPYDRSATPQGQSKGIFSSATIDDEAGELIVKIVNTGGVATTANLSLKHFTPREARVIRLAANSGEDENTLDNPTNISPREQQLSPDCDRVQLDVPAYSLNIVRVHGFGHGF